MLKYLGRSLLISTTFFEMHQKIKWVGGQRGGQRGKQVRDQVSID